MHLLPTFFIRNNKIIVVRSHALLKPFKNSSVNSSKQMLLFRDNTDIPPDLLSKVSMTQNHYSSSLNQSY